MGRYPNVYCVDCGDNKKLVYDPVNSVIDKLNPSKQQKSYWCMNCNQIIAIRKFVVNDKVTSVRAYVFKQKLPEKKSRKSS